MRLIFIKIYYQDKYVRLIQGDCLEIMDELIEEGIKFDAIITDPPYGTTQCKWDCIIPLDAMWKRINKLKYDNTPVLLFGTEPFSTMLRISNIKEYKYDWIMKKSKSNGFLNAKKMPLKATENICVFYKSQPTYNPQGLIKIDKIIKNAGTKSRKNLKKNGDITSAHNTINRDYYKQEFTNYPINIIECSNGSPKSLHPTQKPLDVIEYLIKTYTNENDLILDFTCGSGTTLVAAQNLNRRCIGIELEEKYCEVAKNRLEKNLLHICNMKNEENKSNNDKNEVTNL